LLVGLGNQYAMTLVTMGRYAAGSPRLDASMPIENVMTDREMTACISKLFAVESSDRGARRRRQSIPVRTTIIPRFPER
jgi:hypothetical protein